MCDFKPDEFKAYGRVFDLKSLNSIEPGERAVISEIKSAEGIRRRLLDIGMIPGTEVECVGRSPSGDPKAFLIRGAVIAIRSEDSAGIIVC